MSMVANTRTRTGTMTYPDKSPTLGLVLLISMSLSRGTPLNMFLIDDNVALSMEAPKANKERTISRWEEPNSLLGSLPSMPSSVV